MQNTVIKLLAVFMLLCFTASGAHADEKRKSYDRPYGNSLNDDYQNDYHRGKRVKGESLFTQDLHQDDKTVYRKRESFDENQSYMVPENKKTIPTWGTR